MAQRIAMHQAREAQLRPKPIRMYTSEHIYLCMLYIHCICTDACMTCMSCMYVIYVGHVCHVLTYLMSAVLIVSAGDH